MVFNQADQVIHGFQTNVSRGMMSFPWKREEGKRTLSYNGFECVVYKSKSIEFGAIVEIKHRNITVLNAEINSMSSGVVLVEMYLELMEM